MTKQIQLSEGKIALVDDEDFERINAHKWHANKYRNGRFYAVRHGVMGLFRKTLLMHREILGFPSGMETDHINGDPLDNRKSNLRICTTAENQRNRGKQTNNASGFKGVIWSDTQKEWVAHIKVDRKKIYLGHFQTAEDAARAYDRAALERHGEFAKTNF